MPDRNGSALVRAAAEIPFWTETRWTASTAATGGGGRRARGVDCYAPASRNPRSEMRGLSPRSQPSRAERRAPGRFGPCRRSFTPSVTTMAHRNDMGEDRVPGLERDEVERAMVACPGSAPERLTSRKTSSSLCRILSRRSLIRLARDGSQAFSSEAVSTSHRWRCFATATSQCENTTKQRLRAAFRVHGN